MSGTRQKRHHVTKGERGYLGTPTAEPWIWLSRSMIESPAYRALSLAGTRVLMRLCLENMNHAGRENGRLAVSYDAFVQHGIHRTMIFQALAEVTALGFVVCTREGRRAWGADPGRRATYRLTFYGVVGDDSSFATDEWRLIKTDDEAGQVVARSRLAKGAARGKAKETANGLAEHAATH